MIAAAAVGEQGAGSEQGHSRKDKRGHRPDRDGAGGGWGGWGGRGDGEMTLTGGPGLPSKPEAPWTKGEGHGLTQRKGREGAGERKRETTGRGEVSRA